MRLMITGGESQLGQSLIESQVPAHELLSLSHKDCDLCDKEQIAARIAEFKADVIINCAAYNNVDKAEKEEAAAFAVNAEGVRNIALAAKKTGARVIHFSTDYVFDGCKCAPYEVDDPVSPLNVYGRSKAAGEGYLQEILPDNSLIIRTSWLHSIYGSNFVKKMINVMIKSRKLQMVDDQFGTPTWAGSVASALWVALEYPQVNGIVHWTDGGMTSWYEFALLIFQEASAYRMVNDDLVIEPIKQADYHTAAKRPPYSVLSKARAEKELKLFQVPWEANVRHVVSQLAYGKAAGLL